MTHNDDLFPISTNVGVVGFTPDPLNPGLPNHPPFPPLQVPPFEIPQFPPLQLCNLKFPEGCYHISMDSLIQFPQIAKNFEGSMRVENLKDVNGNVTHAISGDFYRKPSIFVFPGAQPVSQRIPIFSRKQYHSYLKVVNVSKTRFVPFGGKCKITLTVEEYRYTPPAPGAVNGNFSSTPTRTLRIELTSVANPAGLSGPSFEGKVFEGVTQLSVVFKMTWVSNFFRRASLELENVVGAAIPVAAGVNDFRSIYASVGWDLNVVMGDTNLPVPAGVGPANPWTNATLHAFMLANRNPLTNLDKEWRYYYVAVPHSSDQGSIFGIMFDQIDDQREGSCNFINNMTGDFADAASKLRSAAHEIGHGFNQLHPQNDGLPLENFIMTQSGATRSAILAAGGTYPNDIRFEFSDHHRHHFVHAPDVVVRPGGEDFGFGHSILAGSFNPEDADTAANIGLDLQLDTLRNHIKLGEPLVLKIALRNNGNADVNIPETISWVGSNTDIAVGKVGGEMRNISSFAHVCDSMGFKVLASGKDVSVEELVFWDTQGFVFTQPGVHKVEVNMRWNVDGLDLGLRAERYVWVDYPVTAKENEAAALLMHPEVGKYVALGGNAKHLDIAVERIDSAGKLAKDFPGYDCIAQLDAKNSYTKSSKK
jgi:hypothetical protein